jgi:hypothetical protein
VSSGTFFPLLITIPVVLLNRFGRYVENIGVDLIDFLFADIGDVVLAYVFRGQNEGQAVFDV